MYKCSVCLVLLALADPLSLTAFICYQILICGNDYVTIFPYIHDIFHYFMKRFRFTLTPVFQN